MAGKTSLRTIQSDNRDLNLVQDNVNLALGQIQDTPFSGGNLPTSSTSTQKVQTVALAAGQSNLIPHGLGRAAQYFVLLGQDTNTNVWREVPTGIGAELQEKNFIDLRCGTDCNVKVWVN